MFNRLRLGEILDKYKKNFNDVQWSDKKFKWEAVKHFQDNWDADAPDFADMLARSISKASVLLDSTNNFPSKMIKSFATAAPEEVRSMFNTLFDASDNVVTRTLNFESHASELLEKYGNGAGQHYQYESVVSTYLFLRHPDKYYIYKYDEAKIVSEQLNSNYNFKEGDHFESLQNFYTLYDEIREELQKDNSLVSLLNAQLTDTCYQDRNLHILTTDLGDYIVQNFKKSESSTPTQKFFHQRTCRLENTSKHNNFEKYGKSDFLNEVFMTEKKYNMLVTVLKNKKNIILQGAPGVGKTFVAKRLAYSIMGEKNEKCIEFIQFHQNYSYEDFMMGYKPANDGFELKYGIFYRFCQKAATKKNNDFFFVIDEINRGNMSKIFGELLMLIERDYRGTSATLAYDGLTFAVPKNLYIIGMMNTADRSLAMIDYALRRRFSFFDVEPGFSSDGFKKYQKKLNDETFNLLISKIQELNLEIATDESLGKGFLIGHSYFCGQTTCSKEWMESVVDYDILPMLSEYWFDDSDKLHRWKKILHDVLK